MVIVDSFRVNVNFQLCRDRSVTGYAWGRFSFKRYLCVTYQKKRATELTVTLCFYWSGRLDSNQRPLDPQSSALPGCATPRYFLCELHKINGQQGEKNYPSQSRNFCKSCRTSSNRLFLPVTGSSSGRHFSLLAKGLAILFLAPAIVSFS